MQLRNPFCSDSIEDKTRESHSSLLFQKILQCMKCAILKGPWSVQEITWNFSGNNWSVFSCSYSHFRLFFEKKQWINVCSKTFGTDTAGRPQQDPILFFSGRSAMPPPPSTWSALLLQHEILELPLKGKRDLMFGPETATHTRPFKCRLPPSDNWNLELHLSLLDWFRSITLERMQRCILRLLILWRFVFLFQVYFVKTDYIRCEQKYYLYKNETKLYAGILHNIEHQNARSWSK